MSRINRSYMTANDLQEWINRLTDKEKELPIIFSEKMFPETDEMLHPKFVGRFLSCHGFDGYVVVCHKDYERIIKKEGHKE